VHILRYASVRTWALLFAGALGVAATFTFLRTSFATPQLAGIANNLPSVAIPAYAALLMWWCARRLESIAERRIAILLGAGAWLYAAGSAAWGWIEAVQGNAVPFPGVPDIFYVLMYLPLTVAAWMGLTSNLTGGDRRRALLLSAAFSAGVGVALFGAVGGAIAGGSSGWLATVLSFAYPAFDVVLLFWPALALAIAGGLSEGGIQWGPWTSIIAGFAVLALTDALFTVETWNETYVSGGWLDLGWILAFLLLGAGVSLMLDRDIASARGRAMRSST
jgi:hypothetical protein